MAGVGLQVEMQGIERLNVGIQRLQGLGRNRDLFDVVGAVGESQLKKRISSEKTDPDGNAWVDWSEDYAKTRHGNHSLLMDEGNLEHSITFDASDDQVVIGTNVVYAARQNAQREFVGFSDDNWDEIGDAVESFIDELLS